MLGELRGVVGTAERGRNVLLALGSGVAATGATMVAEHSLTTNVEVLPPVAELSFVLLAAGLVFLLGVGVAPSLHQFLARLRRNSQLLRQPPGVIRSAAISVGVAAGVLLGDFLQRDLPLGSFVLLLLSPMLLSLGVARALRRVGRGEVPSGQPQAGAWDDQDYSDSPLEKIADDLLDRKNVVENLAAEFSRPRARHRAYALSGPRGIGKTSILNFLQEHLTRHAPSVLIVRFDPWHFDASEHITTSLYHQIDCALNEQFLLPDLHGSLKRYSSLINAGLDWAKLPALDLNPADDLGQTRDRIQTALAVLPGRVLLIVDDLDRLPAEMLQHTLKLIRLTANFDGLDIIVALDHTLLDAEGTAVYEKVIERTVTIAPLAIDQIRKQFYDPDAALADEHLGLLEKALTDTGVDEATRRQLHRQLLHIWNVLETEFQTPRDLKRLANTLLLSLPHMWTEVNLSDYVVATYLKLFAPRAWSLIWKHQRLFLGTHSLVDKLHAPKDDKTFNDAIANVVAAYPERSVAVRRLLMFLFSEVAAVIGKPPRPTRVDALQDRRISCPEYFSNYFQDVLERGNVPDRVVDEFLRLLNAEDEALPLLQNIREDWHENMDQFFLKVIRRIDVVAGHRLPSLILATTAEIGAYPDAGFGSAFDTARILVLRAMGRVVKSDRADLFRRVITEAPRLLFAQQVFLELREDPSNEYREFADALLHKELGGKLRERLRERYIAEGRSIFVDEPNWGIEMLLQWHILGGASEVDGAMKVALMHRPLDWKLVANTFRFLTTDRAIDYTTLCKFFDVDWLLRFADGHETELRHDPETAVLVEKLKALHNSSTARGADRPDEVLPGQPRGTAESEA